MAHNFPYGSPPQSLREALGEEGYEYLQRLHELLAGVGPDGLGSLDVSVLGLSHPDEDVIVFAGPDGSFQAKKPTLDVMRAQGAGIVAADADGRLSPGPIAPGAALRRVVRATEEGNTFDDALDTEVAGAATLTDPGDVPADADADTKARQYLRNGFLVLKHTFAEGKVLDPASGIETPVNKTLYKYLNLRNDQSRFETSEADPSEVEVLDGQAAPSSLTAVTQAIRDTTDFIEVEVFS